MQIPDPAKALSITSGMDAWLETMRCPGGYGGPVAHWWQHCLHYTGVGLDWRYEGIIAGYLNLYQKTGQTRWLDKARRAGDDLVKGQHASGNFIHSCFEMNPYSSGTPHEAACDLGLLGLARCLRDEKDPSWAVYASTAERNIQCFLVGKLWNETRQGFCEESPSRPMTMNKIATIVEVLFSWADLSCETTWLESYGRLSLNTILARQIRVPGNRFDGAIEQVIQGERPAGAYFPFYIARCIPALILGYHWMGDRKYLQAASAAMAFILRERYPDGSFPQVLYKNGRIKRYPQWIAGAGDILRAMSLMQKVGMDLSMDSTIQWLFDGILPGGGCKTARGFASQSSQKKPASAPDFLDILPACGWVDKAFRFMTGYIPTGTDLSVGPIGETYLDCLYSGSPARYHEDASCIEVWQGKNLAYRWKKGKDWADTPVFFG